MLIFLLLLELLVVVTVVSIKASEKYFNEHLNLSEIVTYNLPKSADGFNILVRALFMFLNKVILYFILSSLIFHL